MLTIIHSEFCQSTDKISAKIVNGLTKLAF